MKKWVILTIVLIFIGSIGFYFWRQNQAHQFSERAREALAKNDFQTARVFAERALGIRPNHAADLICYSESVFKDTSIDAEQRVKLALEALAKVPDQSSEGYTARVHEASILFFDQLKVVQAEQRLQRAINIKPNGIEAIRSLVQIYCCTGRATFTEPLFRKMIDVAETNKDKIDVMTTWFLSQFSEQTLNSSTDQLLRVNALYELDIPVSQKRLLAFRDSDPQAVMPRVALAYWFYIRSDGKQAKTLLDQIDPEAIDLTDPLYLMTAVNVYLECGEIDLAKELHGVWNDQSYFEYWRQKGVLEQDYENDSKAAVASLEKAQAIWPGQVDPSVYFRLSTCHKILGNSDKSEKYRSLGEKMRNATDLERIKKLQGRLLQGNLTPSDCREFENFYLAFGREFEAQQWRELGESLIN